MQIYAIAVLLLVSSTLGYNDVNLMNQQMETSTMNDLDNSVYSENGTPAPVPPFPAHMPTTGCFSHIPAGHEVDPIGTDNVETATNYPQPQLPLSDPIPPQFNSFGPPIPFNRPVNPGFGPGSNGYRNYYPFNRPVPFAPPMPFSPYQRMGFPNQPNSPHPIVIVKLLQPIILPVAKPMFPEGGDRNPDVDEVDGEKYTNGFNRGHGFRRFNSNSLRRFGAERYRSVERPLPYRQNTFGPYKIGGGEENIHVTVKLH